MGITMTEIYVKATGMEQTRRDISSAGGAGASKARALVRCTPKGVSSCVAAARFFPLSPRGLRVFLAVVSASASLEAPAKGYPPEDAETSASREGEKNPVEDEFSQDFLVRISNSLRKAGDLFLNDCRWPSNGSNSSCSGFKPCHLSIILNLL
ncbi:hypothetical protein C8R44DRAFT_738126 [Mycena epipterygia]|nr:hypothetical protein C8R44DRAFT_738126 [Mycena epipterygia]